MLKHFKTKDNEDFKSGWQKVPTFNDCDSIKNIIKVFYFSNSQNTMTV